MAAVLIVEDDAELRRVTTRVFERAGHRVVTAVDGVTALALISGTRPDLVVTDIRMPGMDGAELVRRLRADPATAQIPVIAFTAEAHLEVDADLILTKPCPPPDLLAAAHSLVEAAQGGEPASSL